MKSLERAYEQVDLEWIGGDDVIARMVPDEIDMSPRAVAARLDEVRALYRLVLYLEKFKTAESTVAQRAEQPSQREE